MVTANLEKIFFNWILLNPKLFNSVHGYFFETNEIQFVYNLVKNEYLKSDVVPNSKEIYRLVEMYDKKSEISLDLVKALLKYKQDDYRKEYVEPKIEAWIKSSTLIHGLLNSIDVIKGLDKTNIVDVDTAISNVKGDIDNAVNVTVKKGDLGLDFDDEYAHNQDTEVNKITTGIECMDTITEGGFDRKTLNILMGGPGSGKCTFSSTLITVRNQRTGEIKNVTMEEFFTITRPAQKDII